MSEPISESLRTIHRRGMDAFGATRLATDVGPTVRRVARRRVARAAGTVAAAVALVAAVTVGALGYSGRTASPAVPSPSPSSHPSAERVLVTVSEIGDRETDVAEALAAAGVIGSAQEFVNAADKDPSSVLQIAPGQYWLPRGMTASDAIAAMLDPWKRNGPNVSFAQGSTKEVIFRQLRVAATEALSAMVEATIAHLDERGVAPTDRQRVLTIASLVDMESPLADDRSKVARTLLNRLAEGIPLDLEPGVAFVRDSDGAWVEQVNRDIYRPGNTYLKPGLPAAPLASPSTDAIEAALHPANGPWLYFVPGIPPNGQTQYLATYEEYQVAIAAFGAWMETGDSALSDEVGRLQDATDAAGS